jgi:hypothetical protein
MTVTSFSNFPPLLVALATQGVFLAGEAAASQRLFQDGLETNFYQSWFLIFCLTRIIGMAGQIYLWAHHPMGVVAAMLSVSGIIASNLISGFLGQGSLTTQTVWGLGLACSSLILLNRG